MSSLGDRLRGTRRRRGLTQQDLAQAAGVSLSLIRRLEQDEQQDTRMATAHRLAAALRIPATRLISRAELPRPPVHADELWRPVQQAIEQPPQQPEEPATLDDVTAALGAARVVHFRAGYAQLAVMLPGLIRDADRARRGRGGAAHAGPGAPPRRLGAHADAAIRRRRGGAGRPAARADRSGA